MLGVSPCQSFPCLLATPCLSFPCALWQLCCLGWGHPFLPYPSSFLPCCLCPSRPWPRQCEARPRGVPAFLWFLSFLSFPSQLQAAWHHAWDPGCFVGFGWIGAPSPDPRPYPFPCPFLCHASMRPKLAPWCPRWRLCLRTQSSGDLSLDTSSHHPQTFLSFPDLWSRQPFLAC